MTDSICILGRQPALGMAELESLFGAKALQPIAPGIVQLRKDPKDVAFSRLGGCVKLAKLLTELPNTKWPDLISYIIATLPKHLQYYPDGKLKVGLSVYGLTVNPSQINRAGLEIKKTIRANGRSARVVPNNGLVLSSAQVLHNNLTGSLGLELLLIRHGNRTLLAQTVHEQDIEAYGRRDQARPKRDARVGMLPPKLAQIIVNLAHPKSEGTILDPFCGTGVILQEALLMGLAAYGSDNDERMIDYSKENIIQWLLHDDGSSVTIEYGDATTHSWQSPFDSIASETYLGQAFSHLPSPEKLQDVIQTCNQIIKKFLQNVASQTESGFRLCIAVPAWKTNSGFKHLPTLEKLSELGYNRVSFVHARDSDLVYFRPDQVVARELITLQRK